MLCALENAIVLLVPSPEVINDDLFKLDILSTYELFTLIKFSKLIRCFSQEPAKQINPPVSAMETSRFQSH